MRLVSEKSHKGGEPQAPELRQAEELDLEFSVFTICGGKHPF